MSAPVRDLGAEVYEIDTLTGGARAVTAGYLIRSSRPALVETGGAVSAPVIREALAQLGVGVAELATIVVTHIHLDHAGGVGDLAETYPNAEVVVHESGARHLVSPQRLVASARAVFGEALDRLFGELRPTAADRIRSVAETGSVDLGDGRRLATHYSPGRARHHIGMLDSQTGDLYVGDAAGIYLANLDLVRASTPPPDFDLPTSLASIDKFEALAPVRLLFSHFGPVNDVAGVLGRSRDELHYWVEQVGAARGETPDLDHAVELVRTRVAGRYPSLQSAPDRAGALEGLSSVRANVVGIGRYLDHRGAAGG
ncbi:MAG: MBL fold metallo-hydrolase [Mycobacteriales bacterium]